MYRLVFADKVKPLYEIDKRCEFRLKRDYSMIRKFPLNHNDEDQDHVHKVFDDLRQFGLIKNIRLRKQESIRSNYQFGKTIYYNPIINDVSDEAVVFFLGHEYGHVRPSKRDSLLSQIFILTIIAGFIFKIHYILIMLWVVFFLRWFFPLREFRCDKAGAEILIEYGRKKNKKVHPSKSFKELADAIKTNFVYELIANEIFKMHPSDEKRIRNLKELEKYT